MLVGRRNLREPRDCRRVLSLLKVRPAQGENGYVVGRIQAHGLLETPDLFGIRRGHDSADVIFQGVQTDVLRLGSEILLCGHESGLYGVHQVPRGGRLDVDQLQQ